MPEERRKWVFEILSIVISSAFHAGSEKLFIVFLIPTVTFIISFSFSHYIVSWISLTIIFFLLLCYVTWAFTQYYHRRKDENIASEFLGLHEEFRPFEQMSLQLLSSLSTHSISENIDNELKKLSSAHYDYLTKLCVTATRVLGAKKGRKLPLTANIKRIYANAEKETLYSFLAGSEKKGTARSDYEENQKNRILKINSNYMYKRMFDPAIRKDYYICHNIDDIFKDVKKGEEIIDEPNSQSGKLYRSFIIYPIYGDSHIQKEPNERQIYKNLFDGKEIFLYKDKEVFGLLCVDSARHGAFNLGYDLVVMRQLTSYAFESFRMVRAIQETAELLNAKTNGK